MFIHDNRVNGVKYGHRQKRGAHPHKSLCVCGEIFAPTPIPLYTIYNPITLPLSRAPSRNWANFDCDRHHRSFNMGLAVAVIPVGGDKVTGTVAAVAVVVSVDGCYRESCPFAVALVAAAAAACEKGFVNGN